MTSLRQLSEVEINAFADGELSGEAKEDVRLALEGDEAARGVAVWRDVLGDRMHKAYDPVLDEPLPAQTARLLRTPNIWSLPRGTRRAAAALAFAAAAACIGYVAGLQTMNNGAGTIEQVAQRAIGAHQVFASEIRHPVEVPGSDADHLAKWLGKRIGVSFTAPEINDAGFALVGGRLLAEGARPAALLMYEDATGRRVTLYIEKWGPDGEDSMRNTAGNGLNTFFWFDNHFACAVSSNIDSDKLKVVAGRLYAALELR